MDNITIPAVPSLDMEQFMQKAERAEYRFTSAGGGEYTVDISRGDNHPDSVVWEMNKARRSVSNAQPDWTLELEPADVKNRLKRVAGSLLQMPEDVEVEIEFVGSAEYPRGISGPMEPDDYTMDNANYHAEEAMLAEEGSLEVSGSMYLTERELEDMKEGGVFQGLV